MTKNGYVAGEPGCKRLSWTRLNLLMVTKLVLEASQVARTISIAAGDLLVI